MIQCQLKLRPTPRQERTLAHWLYHLTPVWNWAIARIRQDADVGIYHGSIAFRGILNGHGAKIGVPQDALCGILWTAHTAWQRCFKKISKRPRFKGRRNQLNSIAFAHGTKIIEGRIHIPTLGRIRFYKQEVPVGHISQFRLMRRPSGCILERVKGHPLFRYRWSMRREGRDHDFEVALETACDAFGLQGE